MEFLIPPRTARPGDDPIFALHAEAKRRKAAGESVINATVGALLLDDGKLAVLGGVAEAIRSIPTEVSAAYAPIAGNPAFLQGVTQDLLGGREAADWAAIAATPGGTGALRHGIANFLEPQQTLLTTSYYWSPYRTLSDECDRNLSTFNMFGEDGRFDHVDFDARLGKLLDSQGRALVILNSPCHNPTGYSYDPDEWGKIAEVVEGRSKQGPIAVMMDVAYAQYGAQGLDLMLDATLRLAGKALLLFAWSASKAFLQYGLRVGALVAVHPDPEERKRIQNALSYSCRGTWSNCNAGGMAGIARVLTEPDLRARVASERAELKGLLDRRVAKWNELAGKTNLKYPRYDGGFFVTVFTDDPKPVAEKMRAEGVFVVPLNGALRVALCAVPEADLPRLVECMAKHVPA